MNLSAKLEISENLFQTVMNKFVFCRQSVMNKFVSKNFFFIIDFKR